MKDPFNEHISSIKRDMDRIADVIRARLPELKIVNQMKTNVDEWGFRCELLIATTVEDYRALRISSPPSSEDLKIICLRLAGHDIEDNEDD